MSPLLGPLRAESMARIRDPEAPDESVSFWGNQLLLLHFLQERFSLREKE